MQFFYFFLYAIILSTIKFLYKEEIIMKHFKTWICYSLILFLGIQGAFSPISYKNPTNPHHKIRCELLYST